MTARGTLLGICLVLACGPAENRGEDCGREAGWSAEAGFVSVEAAQYQLADSSLESAAAELFYSFHPASSEPESAPLLVAFAGGPSASSMFLLALNTAPYAAAADPGGSIMVAANPHSFTDLASLLFIDARNAGFSYPMLSDPSDPELRLQEFAVHNYNVYRDAADFLHVLLSFLEQHPELSDNSIVLMGESYGGLRATAMLNLLLFHEEYRRGERPFYAPALLDRIARHFQLRFGDAEASSEVVAEQFVGQVLLEPALAGSRHREQAGVLFEVPGSVIDQLASEAGVAYERCAPEATTCSPYDNALAFLATIGRDRYDYRETSSWLARQIALISTAATSHQGLATLLGVELEQLDEIFSRPRPQAYRFADSERAERETAGDLELHFGEVAPWDAHFVAINYEAFDVFGSLQAKEHQASAHDVVLGDLFLENLRYTGTLLTRADYDLAVYGPAVVPTLESLEAVSRASVEPDATGEEILIQYADGTLRTILSPRYRQSSHSVPKDEPAKLHDDVADFLRYTVE
jgi:hypothetical protein